MAEKLTDRTAKTSSFANDDVIHVVDVSDTSQDPAGSSFKSSLGNIYGSYLAPKITSSQIIDNAANDYSLTLADTSSTNHFVSVETNDGNAFVNVVITSYATPKDGAILVIKLNQSGIGTLTIPGFTSSGFESGIYTARYSTSEADWVAVNYLELSVVDEFTDLNDVPSSYSGQANKVVKVNAGATGLEFGQEVHNLKVSLSAAQIKTANSVPIDIGLPASGVGYYWRVVAFDGRLTFGSTAFTSSNLFIADPSIISAARTQRYLDGILASTVTTFSSSRESPLPFENLVENGSLVLASGSDSGVGDSTIDCYISVQKVKL
jgi:hypothetical protein